MRVLKWLFQPVYLLLIIVIVALYVNREAIFSDEVAESLEAEALVGKVDELVERLSVDAPLETSVEITSEPDVTESPDAPHEAAESETVAAVSDEVALTPAEEPASPVAEEPLPVAEESAPVVEEPLPVVEEPLPVVEVPLPVVEEPLPVVEEPLPVVEELAPVAEEPAPVAEVAPVVSSELQPTTPEDEVVEVIEEEAPEVLAVAPAETQSVPEPLPEDTAAPVVSPLATWRAARTAVWQGDLNGAVAHYRQLISQQPNNYDAYGEMGNVLLAQSDVSAAVEAYVAAARLIRQSGNQQMARRLVGVVATLDEAQGRALYNEFNQ